MDEGRTQRLRVRPFGEHRRSAPVPGRDRCDAPIEFVDVRHWSTLHTAGDKAGGEDSPPSMLCPLNEQCELPYLVPRR